MYGGELFVKILRSERNVKMTVNGEKEGGLLMVKRMKQIVTDIRTTERKFSADIERQGGIRGVRFERYEGTQKGPISRVNRRLG